MSHIQRSPEGFSCPWKGSDRSLFIAYGSPLVLGLWLSLLAFAKQTFHTQTFPPESRREQSCRGEGGWQTPTPRHKGLALPHSAQSAGAKPVPSDLEAFFFDFRGQNCHGFAQGISALPFSTSSLLFSFSFFIFQFILLLFSDCLETAPPTLFPDHVH